jgi:hydrogenase maturation protein HypF
MGLEADAPATSLDQPQERAWVKILGAVQGVGFRPFVYRLATELGLAGWVINDSRGVLVEVEGSRAQLERFLTSLATQKPPRAIVQDLEVGWLDPVGYQGFKIRHSDHEGAKTVLVLPDVATCADCLAEVMQPTDRRFRYPFTNCTNCGPRFSIIQALPYDRPNTTMRRFVMCPDCQAEYDSPLDRRFHAQPNACPLCGPRLTALRRVERAEVGTAADSPWPGNPAYHVLNSGHAALQEAAMALLRGQIVAVKGLGGFHLMVDANNAPAIDRLRERKPRRDKPFAVMVADLTQARQLVLLTSQAEDLLASPEAPILLLPRRPDAPVADNVAPGNPSLGIMLPYTPLHHLLLQATGRPVACSSRWWSGV